MGLKSAPETLQRPTGLWSYFQGLVFSEPLITARNFVCGKVMFSGLFVCPQGGAVKRGVTKGGGCYEGECHEGGCHEGGVVKGGAMKEPPSCTTSGRYAYYRNAFLLWKVVNLPVFSACGGDLTSEHGAFNSPQYPAPYPNNRECIWTIKASPGNSIIVTFRYQAHLHWEKMEVKPKKDQWKVKMIKEKMTNIKEKFHFRAYFVQCKCTLTRTDLRTIRRVSSSVGTVYYQLLSYVHT